MVTTKQCMVSQQVVRTVQYRSSRGYSALAGSLLQFFARQRAAIASQVQRQFIDQLPSDRTTRMHLQTLVVHGDLQVVRTQGISGPNIYLITSRGLRNAGEDSLGTEYPRWRRQQTGSHLTHELLITEAAVSLAETARRRTDLQVPWEERFGLAQQLAAREPVADYAFLFHHRAGRLICLVEVSSGEESPTRLRHKLEHYAAWSETGEAQAALVELYRRSGAHNPRPEFRLLFVVHHRRTGSDMVRVQQFVTATSHVPEALRRRLWTTTAGELTATGVDGPIWLRHADLEAAAERLSDRRRLAALLKGTPRQRLFPRQEDRPP